MLNPKLQERLEQSLQDAYKRHPEVHPSYEHSAFVLLEEVEELKKELFMQEGVWDVERIHTEATHVAVCALRLINDFFTRTEV